MMGSKAAALVATVLLLSAITVVHAAEVVYDDFNDEALGTNLGGAAGTMSYDGNHDPQVNLVQGYEGKALALAYNIQAGQWCGYWSFFRSDEGGYDLRGYTDLQMWVRGASGGETFKVEMKDTSNKYRAIYITLVGGFESGAGTSWRKLVIPLYNFAPIVDLGNVKQLCLRQGSVAGDHLSGQNCLYNRLPGALNPTGPDHQRLQRR
jgi:hypothetical protein